MGKVFFRVNKINESDLESADYMRLNGDGREITSYLGHIIKYPDLVLNRLSSVQRDEFFTELHDFAELLRNIVRGSQHFNEGFSYYDKTQWLPEKNFFENNFRVFCRKHNIVIPDKKLYDLCELLYDGILKYSFDALQELERKDIEGYFSQAFYDVRTFLYNRDATSEHYTEFPSGNDLYKLRKALRIIGCRSFGPYNFVYPSEKATEMLNNLQVK